MDSRQLRGGNARISALAIRTEDVQPGYKQTEVGVIPEEWNIDTIGNIAQIHVGRDVDFDHFSSEPDAKFCYPVYSNTVEGSGLYGYYDRPDYEGSSLTVVGRGIGLGTAFTRDGGFGAIGRLLVLFPHFGISAHYLAEYINNYVKLFNESSGIPQLTRPSLSKYQVPLPCPQEQRAIAEALSDVDGLIEALDALIAKKRAIKQAAMQQLLTGKTRLPGFNGAWKSVLLGEHVTFLKTGTDSRADLRGDGPVKYLHYGDIHTSNDVRLDARVTSMPCLPEKRARTLDRLRTGDLVFVDASEDLDGVGKSVEISGDSGVDIVSGLHTIAARFDKSVIADGFKAYLQFCPVFRNKLKRLAAGTKVFATSRTHISSVVIPLPGPKEQTAIATILSDMDAEIAALERRRDKTRAIKQGMMQQLLTGRIRLVEPVQAETRA